MAESRIRQKTLVGVLATGRTGLGYFRRHRSAGHRERKDTSYARKRSVQVRRMSE